MVELLGSEFEPLISTTNDDSDDCDNVSELSAKGCPDSDFSIILSKTLTLVISTLLSQPFNLTSSAKFFRNCSKIFTAAVCTSFDKVPCLTFSLSFCATAINCFSVTILLFCCNKVSISFPSPILKFSNFNAFKAVSNSLLVLSTLGSVLAAFFALLNHPLLYPTIPKTPTPTATVPPMIHFFHFCHKFSFFFGTLD